MKRKPTWRNWSRSVQCAPLFQCWPMVVEEVQHEVARAAEAGVRLRVAGAGRSFTPLCYTDGGMMYLSRFTGIESMDHERRRVWVRAGTRMRQLGHELAQFGLALENLGDIDADTVAGAVATGAHGTGAHFGNLSTQVLGVRLVCADGSLRDFNAKSHLDMFPAAQLSLGALGVITHVELQCVDSYHLRYRARKATLGDTLQRLDEYTHHRNFEFYWFPHSDIVQLRVMDLTGAPQERLAPLRWAREALLEDGTQWMLSRFTRRVPAASQVVSRMFARYQPESESVRPGHRAYSTRHPVRFHKIEYAIAADALPEVLRHAQRLIHSLGFRVHFPLEVRFVRRDEIWLSPAYQRDSAYVAVHMHKGLPYEDYFAAMAEIFDRVDGRPHWGKMHDKRADELARLYPRWDDFLRVRAELDPNGVFLNPHLAELFGIDYP